MAYLADLGSWFRKPKESRGPLGSHFADNSSPTTADPKAVDRPQDLRRASALHTYATRKSMHIRYRHESRYRSAQPTLRAIDSVELAGNI